jgi:hypothetical protein
MTIKYRIKEVEYNNKKVVFIPQYYRHSIFRFNKWTDIDTFDASISIEQAKKIIIDFDEILNPPIKINEKIHDIEI